MSNELAPVAARHLDGVTQAARQVAPGHALVSDTTGGRAVNVAVAFDHRGVHLRDTLLETLESDGHDVLDLGTDYFVMRFRHPNGPDHKKVLDSIKLFGEKVIPHFA